MQNSQTVIWVLGARSPNADKYIGWYQASFPNLNDPDILIVNLDSLDESTLERIDKSKFWWARNMIFNKFLAKPRSIIIYMLSKENVYYLRAKNKEPDKKVSTTNYPVDPVRHSYSNLDLLPIQFSIETLVQGQNIRGLGNGDKLHSYFDNIKSYNRILFDFKFASSLRDLEPTNEEVRTIINVLKSQESPKPSHRPKYPVELVVNPIIQDNSANTISSECYLKVDSYWNSGKVILLPPPTQVSVEESIDSILKAYGKVSKLEPLPSWVYEISLPGIETLQTKKRHLESRRKNLDRSLTKISNKMSNLYSHYRLLASKDRPLENAVCDAFKLIGFTEIRKKRDKGKEDWVFKFKTLKDYQYGVIEVKGADTRTGLRDLRQCDNWVVDYLDEFKAQAKGIFIPNQYRGRSYPDSLAERIRFEDNEIQFVTRRDICILPSCLLFNTVKHVLESGKISREKIEKELATTIGVLGIQVL